MTALLVFVVVALSLWACLYYMAEDQQDETINVDQFRTDRAAVIQRLQAETKAQVTQRRN
jgi:hypothetical protein